MSNFMGTTPQAIPKLGDIYYDVVSNVMRVYDGVQWVVADPRTMEELLWNECLGITFEKEQGLYEPI